MNYMNITKQYYNRVFDCNSYFCIVVSLTMEHVEVSDQRLVRAFVAVKFQVIYLHMSRATAANLSARFVISE